MSLYGVLPTFDHSVQTWKTFKGRLSQWFLANDISEAKDATGIKRRAILLSALNDGTFQLATDLALPKELQSVPYDDILKLLDKHFTTKVCGFGERSRFYSATQNHGETHAQWAARLRGLTAECGFLNVDEALRDRFVMGMLPGPERDKLYAQDLLELTLAKAVELASSVRSAREAAASAAQASPRQEQVFKITQSASKGQEACAVCGRGNHKTAQCRFANYKCKKCNVKGHLRKMCKKVNYVETGDVNEGGDDEKKTILKGISGHFKSGELTAIMGPSGAGKSSLMNALTGFSIQGVTGIIRAGNSVCELGEKQKSMRSLKAYRKKTCYILQDDRLNPLFTVAELMKFAADMKLGNTFSEKLKLTVIQEVLDTLGLSGAEQTRCCNLSGGQRKRLSIAVELIDNPPVVYLDEPTTGLDSLTSAQCIEMLKDLAANGRTIVCTIHQPPASLYSLFDKVYILAEGLCIYNGSSESTVPYLASLGLQCPIYHNPADYILEIANKEYGNFNEVLAQKCATHVWDKKPRTPALSLVKSDSFQSNKIMTLINPPHELYRFGILTKRCLMQQYRDWTTTHLKVLLHIFIGILLGLFYEKAGNDGSMTFNNLGYLIISAAYLCYTSLMPAVLKFPSELSVLKKENFNNWYNLSTYYAAILLTSMPIQVWYSFVYSAPSYLLSGQPLELSRFAMFVLVLANITLLADAIGNVIGTCVNPINGTFFGAITTCAMIVFAGFLVLFSHMNPVMRTISYFSFLRFGFEGLVLSLYSYDRSPLECPSTKDYCHFRYPKELITEFGFKHDNYWTDMTVLILEIIVVRIIAYLTLRRIVKKSH